MHFIGRTIAFYSRQMTGNFVVNISELMTIAAKKTNLKISQFSDNIEYVWTTYTIGIYQVIYDFTTIKTPKCCNIRSKCTQYSRMRILCTVRSMFGGVRWCPGRPPPTARILVIFSVK